MLTVRAGSASTTAGETSECGLYLRRPVAQANVDETLGYDELVALTRAGRCSLLYIAEIVEQVIHSNSQKTVHNAY